VKLVSYAANGTEEGWRAGVLAGETVIDAEQLATRHLPAEVAAGDYASVRGILSLPAAARSKLGEAAEVGDGLPVGEVRLGPPVPDPDKILCLGLNYRAHVDESAMEVPAAPILFAKFRNALIGDGATIELPGASQKVDYEGEMAVVIGRTCKHVSPADALSVVAGYMPFNDISARDLQLQTPQWTAGKAVDSFAPCGPALVTADSIGDPQSLRLQTRLNGELMQDSDTSLMIFPIAETIAFISTLITLVPGDVIATGTPEGVGATREPPVFLQPGDEIEVEISELGVLRNGVAAEDVQAPSGASAA
jgi:acylpyruvate hydrolase